MKDSLLNSIREKRLAEKLSKPLESEKEKGSLQTTASELEDGYNDWFDINERNDH